MAGLGIRLFTDEMINPDLAVDLRQRGYDVLACREAGRANLMIPDDEQLTWAAAQGRTILTYNKGDFLRLAVEWQAAGREHAGIALSPERKELGILLRAVVAHLETVSPQTQHNLVLWLPHG